MPVEAVLVVDDGGHKGEDEAAAAAHFRMAVAVLHVLPQDPRILLVQAHRLLDLPRLTCIPFFQFAVKNLSQVQSTLPPAFMHIFAAKH